MWMQFLIDSANLDEIREAFKLPFISGVTTNTREIAYHGWPDLIDYLKELRSIAKGIVHIQVTTVNSAEMVKEGKAIAEVINDVRIKIPVTIDGLEAIKILANEGIEVAATAVNTVAMGILAAKMGAKSVISYYGVLEDFEEDSEDLLLCTKKAFQTYNYDTEVCFFARNSKQVKKGIKSGADACIMSLEGLKSLFEHPMSIIEVGKMNSEFERKYSGKTLYELI